MVRSAVNSLLRQLRCPPHSSPMGTSPPVVHRQGAGCNPPKQAWAGSARLACSESGASTPAPPCSTSEVFKAVEERLGRLSAAPSIPPLQPVKVVISGPSGVGKDAVIKALQASRSNLHFVVTATSRPRRPGEVEGVDYYFVSKEQFEEWIRQGELLEWALVYGDYKGIPRAQVEAALAQGTDVVFRLDIQGASTIRRTFPDAVSIFLVAESEAVLACRLISRKTEPLDKMITRVQTARQEMRHLRDFNYVVLNREGDLEGAVRQIDAIITAEKHRISRLRWQDGDEPSSGSEQQQQPPGSAAVVTLPTPQMPELQKC